MNPNPKVALRKHMRLLRDGVPAAQRAEWSAEILAHVVGLPEYQSAKTVHCFLSIQSEVDTQPLIAHALAHHKRVVLPVFVKQSDETACTQIDSLNDDEFVVGKMGLRAPKHLRPVLLNEIEVVLVPLLAFTMSPVHRLGYGAGYYDKLLSKLQIPKIGIAFAMQHVLVLPTEPHDAPLDFVVTEGGVKT